MFRPKQRFTKKRDLVHNVFRATSSKLGPSNRALQRLMMQISCSSGTLRALPLFSLLTDAEREAVQPWTQVRTYPARSPILRRGDAADGLFLILAGRVDV